MNERTRSCVWPSWSTRGDAAQRQEHAALLEDRHQALDALGLGDLPAERRDGEAVILPLHLRLDVLDVAVLAVLLVAHAERAIGPVQHQQHLGALGQVEPIADASIT
jgi:hypothetical protein